MENKEKMQDKSKELMEFYEWLDSVFHCRKKTEEKNIKNGI